ncbi:MAG: hypothetical protein NTV81_03460 [Candidatus Komeilibacteria bacterium]|nr:hypothetical protein [Candidatus Komeilibacteria bacterium]
MINKKLLAYLEKMGIPHEILTHKKVYTAYDKAQTLGAKLEQIVKALMVKVGSNYHVVLLPASQVLDLKKLAKALSGNQVKILSEKNMVDLLQGKTTTLHVFASLYGLPLVVEKELTKLKEAIFPAGSFQQSLKMKLKDFLKVEQALVAVFGAKKKLPKISKVKAIKKKAVKKTVRKAVKKIIKKKR